MPYRAKCEYWAKLPDSGVNLIEVMALLLIHNPEVK
jgi:hypothetical protein